MVTTFFHDRSKYQGTAPVDGPTIAKCTEGTSEVDVQFARLRTEALAAGDPFLGYHFLVAQAVADVAHQVGFCAAHIGGSGTPAMIDVEREGASQPSMADTQRFIDEYGRVTLAYIPRWYWRDVWGSPDLRWLNDRGIGLVSSQYTTYSDNGPGWEPYGGVAPVIWQFSSNPLDSNAFKGTVAQLDYLFRNGTRVPPSKEVTMRYVFSGFPDMPTNGDGERVHISDGVRYRIQMHSHTLDALASSAGSGPIVAVTPANSGLTTYADAVWQLCGYADPGEEAGATGPLTIHLEGTATQ